MSSYEEMSHEEEVAREKEVISIENILDKLHGDRRGERDIGPERDTYITELSAIPEEYAIFIEQAEERLELSPEECERFTELSQKFLGGFLNNKGEEKNLKDFLGFKKRFDARVSS